MFHHEVRPRLLSAFLANPANLLVMAVAERKVEGMASGMISAPPEKPLFLFINEVVVSGRLHRQGVARQLVSRIIGEGKELGRNEARVATEVGNNPARALYEATGGAPDEGHGVVCVFPRTKQPGPGRNDGEG